MGKGKQVWSVFVSSHVHLNVLVTGLKHRGLFRFDHPAVWCVFVLFQLQLGLKSAPLLHPFLVYAVCRIPSQVVPVLHIVLYWFHSSGTVCKEPLRNSKAVIYVGLFGVLCLFFLVIVLVEEENHGQNWENFWMNLMIKIHFELRPTLLFLQLQPSLVPAEVLACSDSVSIMSKKWKQCEQSGRQMASNTRLV